MTKTIALVLVLFAACTRNNPNYVGDGPGTGTDGSGDGGTMPACQINSDCHDANNPVCDQGTGSAHDTCRPCELNSECATNACLASGQCVEADQIAYVLSTGSGAACSMAVPCASISSAIELEPYVRILDSITESLAITKTVTLIGDTGVVLTPQTANAPVVSATGAAANVTLSRLEITGATMALGDGVSASGGATLDLDRVDIHDNGHMGVNSLAATLAIDRSFIHVNSYGGIDVLESTYAIQNTIVAGNGNGAGTEIGGVAFAQSTGTMIFSTIASNVGNATVTGITCDGTIDFADDIVYSNAGTQASSGCTFTFSDVQGGSTTGGNMDMPPMLDSTYHLMSSSPVINQADVNATVPLDIDSQHRPQGSVRDMGADEFMQP
jgi:hypothetical protein